MTNKEMPPSITPSTIAAPTCGTCIAACCRLEVLVLTDTGVPEHLIDYDEWGSASMAQLEDGWCAALDRDSYKCSIYENRPLICREFELASNDCVVEFQAREPKF